MNNKIPPPIIALITAVLIWLTARYLPGPRLLTSWQTPLAILLAASGFALDLISLGSFRKAGTTVNPLKPENASSIVNSGLYSFTRNPMYLGLFLILSGWALYQGHITGLFLLAFFVFYMTQFQIKPEERAMLKKFGQSYTDYMARVRRWL